MAEIWVWGSPGLYEYFFLMILEIFPAALVLGGTGQRPLIPNNEVTGYGRSTCGSRPRITTLRRTCPDRGNRIKNSDPSRTSPDNQPGVSIVARFQPASPGARD